MLDVFRHSGFEMSTDIDCGTVSLRFGIRVTESYCAALAVRDQARQMTRRPMIGPVQRGNEC
jgi:hypothetical protein